MKKYYFEPISIIIVYAIVALFLTSIPIFVHWIKGTFSPTAKIIVVFYYVVIITAITIVICLSRSKRIQFDYENKELYIKKDRFKKTIKFEDIISIEILDYNDVAFEFIVKTEKFTKKIAYTRYLHKNPNEEITTELNELKQDLMNISNKNY